MFIATIIHQGAMSRKGQEWLLSFLKNKVFFFFKELYVHGSAYRAMDPGSQKMGSDALELELHMVVS